MPPITRGDKNQGCPHESKGNTKNYLAKDYTVETEAPAEETPEEPVPQAQTYTVEAGDCLWNIAYEVYGTGTRWTVIYEANRDTIRDPGMIHIGQVLTIPAA